MPFPYYFPIIFDRYKQGTFKPPWGSKPSTQPEDEVNAGKWTRSHRKLLWR